MSTFSKSGMIAVCFDFKEGFIEQYQGEQQQGQLVYKSLISSENGKVEEKTISQELFIEKYKNSKKKITKNRYFFEDPHKTRWMIDKYSFLDLVVAISVGEEDFIPEEIKRVCLMEITDDERFDECGLADDFETSN